MDLLDYERSHLEALRAMNAGCTVLLKKDGTFPLKEAGQLALYGSGARHTIKGGTGSGEVNSRFFITAEQGLEDAGFTISTKAWLDGYDTKKQAARKEFCKDIRRKARKQHQMAIFAAMGAIMPEPEYELPLIGEGDTAVYILSRISGEGSDRSPIPGDILLTETEKRDILALNEQYERFMLVLNVGGPVDLTEVCQVKNILLMSQLGTESGAVLADILLGKQQPSGKLTTTWSSWQDYSTIGEACCQDDTRYREGIYVGYRYFDAVGTKALFPFGYGLGYTDFTLWPGSVSLDGHVVTASVTVTNSGCHPGREVAQVYLSAPAGKLDKPVKDLVGFAKTRTLAPGEQQTLQISFDLTDFASYDAETAGYILEPGDYLVSIGNSSASLSPVALLRLEELWVVRAAENVCGKPDFEDWVPDGIRAISAPVGIPVLPVQAEPTIPLARETACEIDPLISAATDDELCMLNVGAFDPKAGLGSIIGSAGRSVAGAAGETAAHLADRGLRPMVMADGPAGVRVSASYYTDSKGAHGLGAALPESFAEFLPGIVRFFMNRKPRVKAGTEILHHYATSIPIGTAIAQSWDVEYAELCGDIVGDEMARFGVHLWLAPALNIHRNIRCGRNFEYYSEDPLISGLFAAAITRGVQAHPGCGTTIKHYCANNQETNRYNNNSLVSERALREIYLKGFGICVRESQPASVMTSYNLLNGVHTSQHRGLIEHILRREYGFRGIVMTDWVISGGMMGSDAVHPAPNAGQVAAAGGDLFMPGCTKDLEEVKSALADGTLTRQQLEINGTRVCRLSKQLTEC